MRKFGIFLFALGMVFCRAQTLTTLAAFSGANGSGPASIIQGADGNFYGTATGGGTHGQGTVFKMTPGGVLATLYNFGSSASDGNYPQGALLQASDGNFYGTTATGGTQNLGTVFKVTPSGAETILYNFCQQDSCADGAYPLAGLVQGADGNLYGTTANGGVATQGSLVYQRSGNVFKITLAGVITTLYNFCSLNNCSDGYFPEGGLVLASDGNFYGTTAGDSVNYGAPFGTIYQLTPLGVLTTIHTFSNSGPSNPTSTLVQGSDGSLYGTTYSGNGSGNYGGVFKVTLGCTYTVLHVFPSAFTPSPTGAGAYPPRYSALALGPGGSLLGGTDDTAFEITTTGTLTTLHTFEIDLEGFGVFGLVLGKDGNVYGTTEFQGPSNDGTFFKLNLQPLTFGNYTCTNAITPEITSVDSASAYGGYSYFGSGSWLEIKGTNLANADDPRLSAATNPGQWTSQDFNGSNAPTSLDGISVTINGKPAYIYYLSVGQLNVQAPEDTTTGNVQIYVTNCLATGDPVMIPRRASAPGLLSPSTYTANGTQYLVALFDSDNAYVLNTSTGASFGLNSRPAKPGDQIYTYGIGFGDVTPSTLPGVIAQASTLVNPVTISFGTTPATITYQGLTPGAVGLYQFNFTVPASLANGDYQINVTQAGAAVPQTLYLTVHN
jgi:uncharacterized protein (TIGR03437 family)